MAQVDPRDMLNNFCFHLYAQKSLFIGENCNAHWDSIGTFRDSPTDICIARTLLSIPRTVLNLVMGRKNLE